MKNEAIQVKSIMSRPVIAVQADDSLEHIAQTLLDNNIGGVPVLDSTGAIIGIITETDFGAKERSVPFSTFRSAQVLDQWLSGNQIEKIYEASRNRKARDIMSSPAKVIAEDDSIEKAARMLLEYDVTRLPVVRDDRPVGMLARHDLLRLVVRASRSNSSTPDCDY